MQFVWALWRMERTFPGRLKLRKGVFIGTRRTATLLRMINESNSSLLRGFWTTFYHWTHTLLRVLKMFCSTNCVSYILSNGEQNFLQRQFLVILINLLHQIFTSSRNFVGICKVDVVLFSRPFLNRFSHKDWHKWEVFWFTSDVHILQTPGRYVQSIWRHFRYNVMHAWIRNALITARDVAHVLVISFPVIGVNTLPVILTGHSFRFQMDFREQRHQWHVHRRSKKFEETER